MHTDQIKNIPSCLRYCLIQSVCLPRGIVVVSVTMEPLEEGKKLGGRCVLLVEGFGVLDSVTT